MSENSYPKIFHSKEKKIRPGSKIDSNMKDIPTSSSIRMDIKSDQKSISSGFLARENNSYIKRRRRISTGEPTTNLTIRAPLSVSNRFIGFTENIRATSYWDALNTMMNMLDIDCDGNIPNS